MEGVDEEWGEGWGSINRSGRRMNKHKRAVLTDNTNDREKTKKIGKKKIEKEQKGEKISL